MHEFWDTPHLVARQSATETETETGAMLLIEPCSSNIIPQTDLKMILVVA